MFGLPISVVMVTGFHSSVSVVQCLQCRMSIDVKPGMCDHNHGLTEL